MSALSLGNLRSIAWHLEQGQDNGDITRDALALFLRSVADELEAFEHSHEVLNAQGMNDHLELLGMDDERTEVLAFLRKLTARNLATGLYQEGAALIKKLEAHV